MPSKLELIIEDDSTTLVVNIEDNPRLSDTIPLSRSEGNQLERAVDGYYVPPTSWEDLKDKPDSTTEEIDDAVSRSEQNASSIEVLEQSKVDKVVGKQLSTEDYSTEEKNKLGGIEAGAQVNSVTSVAGKTGTVALNKTDVGLSNVDNTSDSTKPVSTPQQAAFNLKLDANANAVSASKLATPRTISLTGDASGSTSFDGSANATIVVQVADDSHNHVISNVDGLQTALDSKVDKVVGKGLSTEDFTSAEKSKLAELENFDDSLRDDLATPDKGAAMVAYGGGTVADKLDNITSETANPNPNMFEMVASQVYSADSLLMRVRPSGVSNADRELAVCIPYSHKRGALYQIGREINDRLIRRLIVYSADHGVVETIPISGGDVEPYITNGDKTGTWIRDEFRNNFTTEVGATVSCTFTGTGVSFAFYRDDRGGVWGVSVDGVDMPDISTWAAEPGYPGGGFETEPGIVKVASGLPLGEHTVTLTFKGADPLHEPSDGTARGWVIQTIPTDTTSAQWQFYGTFRILNVIDDVSVTDAMTMSGSNIEFAVLCRPADSPSVPLTWFPEHGGVSGVITILSSKITVDGVAIDLDSPSIYGDPGWHRAGVVQIVQTFTAQNPAQPSRPLVNGSMLMSVTPKGLAISVVFDVLEDLYVSQGYSLMPSAIAADTILTGSGEFRQLRDNDGVTRPLNDSTTGVMYSSSLNDFVVTWEVMNPMQSQRVGKPASASPWTAVSDRELGRLKQYNFIAKNGVIPAGERIVMMGRERCVEIGNPELVFLPSV